MKTEQILTLNEAARLLGFTRYRTANLVGQRLLREVPRPGLKTPGYRRSEVEALQKQLQRELASA